MRAAFPSIQHGEAHGLGRALLLALLAGCLPTEGLLLEARDAGAPRRDAAVRTGMTLQYQITGALDLEVDTQLFVVDLFDVDAAAIARLKQRGSVVVAYVSVGSLESFRSDAAGVPRAALGEPLEAYPNETWLDVRHPEVRTLMEARFDRAVAKGFDGIFASTLGASRVDSGLELTRDDELAYAQFLARAAHDRGLDIGFAADLEFIDALAPSCDFTLALGCFARRTCARLAMLRDRGLAVFDLETEVDRAAACLEADRYGIPITFKRDSYDAYRAVCP